MRFIGRVFVVFFAFLVACLSGGSAIALVALITEDSTSQLAQGLLGAVFLMAATSFLPASLIILLGEIKGFVAIWLYLIFGLVMGAMIPLTFFTYVTSVEITLLYLGHKPELLLPLVQNILVWAICGGVAGATYWLVAGRNAGRWRQTPTAVQA